MKSVIEPFLWRKEASLTILFRKIHAFVLADGLFWLMGGFLCDTQMLVT